MVLSDSHTESVEGLPNGALEEVSGADLVIHAGDYTGPGLLEALRRRGNFKGVFGNMDPPEIKRGLPAVETIEIGGFRIGISHPSEGGAPFGIEERVRANFRDVDAIIFGHTHRTKNERREGIVYFYPGCVSGTFPALAMTFGIMTLGIEVRGEIRSV